MHQIRKEVLNLVVTESFDFPFEIDKDGLYALEITASGKGWWNNLINLRFISFLSDDNLIVKLDNIEFPRLNGKGDLFDWEASWNGNKLNGLNKTNLIVANLDKGQHTLHFFAKKNPLLKSITVYKIKNQEIDYIPENNPAENGNLRPWVTIILANLGLKNLKIQASAQKSPWPKDSDDLKLIIDGNIVKNPDTRLHKNWFWCGGILKGAIKEFNQDLNLDKKLHYIELWADKMPRVEMIKLVIDKIEDDKPIARDDYKNKDEKWWIGWKNIKEYTYKGVFKNENYNRYDEEIKKAVAYWNCEFFKDIDPPEEPLDPNLVKAIIWQESRMGYATGADINLMQVGKTGDDSLKTLRGELLEYWIYAGKEILLEYKEAKVETPRESIYWGVRWLYHKAQGITKNDRKKYWISWKEALARYGPGKRKYTENVWSIYRNGLDKREKAPSKLWGIIFFATSFALLSFFPRFFNSQGSVVAEKNIVAQAQEKIFFDTEILPYPGDSSLFISILESDKDWWENLSVGHYINESLQWLKIDNQPTEQSILEAKFVDLQGFKNPIIEVYGETHAGHGAFYLYEVKKNSLKLLLTVPASVDNNNDIRWHPDNYDKYGYGNCGEIFTDKKLFSDYQDLNGDGFSDVTLSGEKEIICESEEKPHSSKKIVSNPVSKTFIWDNKEKAYFEK